MSRFEKGQNQNPLVLITMELTSRKKLSSCVSSFVPFFLSIPFLFVYFLNRLSIYSTIGFIIVLFLVHFVVFTRFYIQDVFLRAHFLTFLLTIGCLGSFLSLPIGLFTIILAMFHISEYISVALWCPRTLTIDSFLLNHSPQYHAAIVMAYVEYCLEKYFLFPNGVPYYWLWITLGLCMVIGGEYLRKLSMCTAQQSFSHLIEDKPNSEHQLITHGIYQTYRHPSYVGWFWWACGTQILLTNPICFILYLIVSFVQSNQKFELVNFLFSFSQPGCSLLNELHMKKLH